MLNKPVDEIVMENGRVVGVRSEGEVLYTLYNHLHNRPVLTVCTNRTGTNNKCVFDAL